MPIKIDKTAIRMALIDGWTYDEIINTGLCGSKATISKIKKEMVDDGFEPYEHKVPADSGSTVQKNSTVQNTDQKVITKSITNLLTPEEYFRIMARGIPKDIARKLHALTAF